MTNYKSPYKAVGLDAVNAVSGKTSKKTKLKQSRKRAEELPSQKQIAKAKLSGFSNYSVRFVESTAYDKKKGRSKNT